MFKQAATVFRLALRHTRTKRKIRSYERCLKRQCRFILTVEFIESRRKKTTV